MFDFLALAQECAPGVHPQTMAAIARVESGYNPFAIGVVGGHLVRQPVERAEAVATARSLEAQGFNFSLGVGQVNRYNLTRFGLDYESAFDACANLRAGAAILTECYARARRLVADEQAALRASFSCYYSGNFATGFREGYVAKVVGSAAAAKATSIPVIRDAGAKSKRRSNAGGEDVPVSSPATETPQPRTALLF